MKDGNVLATNILPDANIFTQRKTIKRILTNGGATASRPKHHANGHADKPAQQEHTGQANWIENFHWVESKVVNEQQCPDGNCLLIEALQRCRAYGDHPVHRRMLHHARRRPFRFGHGLHSCIMCHEHGDSGNNIEHIIALDRRRSDPHQLKHKIEGHSKNDRLHHGANQPEHGVPPTGFAHATTGSKIDLLEKGKGARNTGARMARFSKHF